MFRPTFIYALFICLFFGITPARADQAFFSVLDEIPLMDGLIEQTDDAVYFDTPEGRIIEAKASGTLPAQSVRAFYTESLAALGWKKISTHAYVRENETLSLYVVSNAGTVSVQVTVSPSK